MHRETQCVELAGNRKPFSFTNTVNALAGQFSPDGQWVAYQTDGSGRTEVYVARFAETAMAGPGAKRQVSTTGGFMPRWSRDGKEILYQSVDRRVVAAEVTAHGDTLEIGAIRSLPAPPLTEGGFYRYDVSADGRILALAPPAGSDAQPLI